MKNNFNILFASLFLSVSSLYGQLLFPSDAYNLAVENSNSIKATQFELEARKEDLNQHIAQKYPQIDFSIDWNKTDFKRNSKIKSSTPKFDETSLDFMFTLNQAIYNKEIDTKLDIEIKRVELFDIKLQQEVQELSKEVLKAYLLALGTQSKIDFLESLVKYNEQKHKSIEKKFKLKLSNKIDLLKAKVELENSKIDLKREKKLFDVYVVKLKQYTLLNEIHIPNINFESFNTNVNNIFDKREFIIDNDIDTNLQIVQSQKEIEFSKLEIKSAKSAYYPKVSFDARFTRYVSDDRTTDYEQMGKVGLRVQIPLYKGGALPSKVQSSKIKQKAAEETLEFIKKDLKSKNDELKTRISSSLESIKIYAEAVSSANSYLEFVTLGYQNGLKSIVDLYEAKNKLFEIKYEYINNVQEFINSYVEYIIINNNMGKIKSLDNILKL